MGASVTPNVLGPLYQVSLIKTRGPTGVRHAIQATENAGLKVNRIELSPGKIIIIPADGEASEATANEWAIDDEGAAKFSAVSANLGGTFPFAPPGSARRTTRASLMATRSAWRSASLGFSAAARNFCSNAPWLLRRYPYASEDQDRSYSSNSMTSVMTSLT
jgi:hypothetical protein